MNDDSILSDPPRQATAEELAAHLPSIAASPRDLGTVELIVVRPDVGQRRCLDRAEVSPEGGVHGDRWQATCGRRGADGLPDPAVQVTLMNARCIQVLAGDRSRWSMAGDNLFVDLDLSSDNLPAGTRLQVGCAILEITEPPHLGCAKFSRRFGGDALKFVNSPEGKSLRLRGAHARVVQPGAIRVGETLRRLAAAH